MINEGAGNDNAVNWGYNDTIQISVVQ